MIKLIQRTDYAFASCVKEAIEARLFIPGYTFETMLRVHDDLITSLAILSDEDGPIGLGMTWYYPLDYEIFGEQIGVFVKHTHRKQGLGSKIVAAMGGVGDRAWRAGDTGSEHFWIKQ